MTIDIAFKTPDALVFATDGLATVMEVDARGQERFLSNMVLRFVDPSRPIAPYKPPKGATAFPRVMLGELTRTLEQVVQERNQAIATLQ